MAVYGKGCPRFGTFGAHAAAGAVSETFSCGTGPRGYSVPYNANDVTITMVEAPAVSVPALTNRGFAILMYS